MISKTNALLGWFYVAIRVTIWNSSGTRSAVDAFTSSSSRTREGSPVFLSQKTTMTRWESQLQQQQASSTCLSAGSSSDGDIGDEVAHSAQLRTQSSKEDDGIVVSNNAEDIILSEERRAELFQFLLRDLQVEGVPLLAVDSNEVDTLQAATWTTMAELLTTWKQCEGRETSQACLVYEDIPLQVLRTFVTDFQTLQTDERLMEQLPELSRFHISLVGKGVGPAILMKLSSLDKNDNSDEKNSAIDASPPDQKVRDVSPEFFQTHTVSDVHEDKLTCAMKTFMDRLVVGSEEGFQPSKADYRVCPFTDVCHVLSAFWNGICQLQATPASELSSLTVVLPAVTEMQTTQGENGLYLTGPDQKHARFSAVAELMSRSLCLYKGDNVFDLAHFHPTYNRDQIRPVEKVCFGHLPPSAWSRPILNKVKDSDAIFSDEDLTHVNYLRRAPSTAVSILRVSLIEAESENASSDIVDLHVAGGISKVSADAISKYAANIRAMASHTKATLDAEHKAELDVLK